MLDAGFEDALVQRRSTVPTTPKVVPHIDVTTHASFDTGTAQNVADKVGACV